MSNQLWDLYEGVKAAFGEDPTKINQRGHRWEQSFIDIGFCGWGPDISYQKCKLCYRTRGVILHPGPNNIRYSGASWVGHHTFESKCDIDCPRLPLGYDY